MAEQDEDELPGATSSGPQLVQPVLIPIGQIVRNDWNPFEQTEQTFDMLCEEIDSDGFDDPMKVAPIDDGKTSEIVRMSGGALDGWLVETGKKTYRISDGEHRWRAGGVFGMAYLSCVIKDWDERTQKIKTARRNFIRGEPDPARMTRLLEDIAGRTISVEAVAKQLGIFDQKKLAQLYLSNKSKLDKAAEKAKKSREDEGTATLGNLTAGAEEIVRQNSKHASQKYMVFTHKKDVQMVVAMDAPLAKTVAALIAFLDRTGKKATDFFKSAIDKQLDEWRNAPSTPDDEPVIYDETDGDPPVDEDETDGFVTKDPK